MEGQSIWKGKMRRYARAARPWVIGMALLAIPTAMVVERLEEPVGAAVAEPSLTGVRRAEHNPYGVNNDLHMVGRSVEFNPNWPGPPNPVTYSGRASHATIHNAGIGWVRYWLSWQQVQRNAATQFTNPNDPTWDWAVPDHDINAAIAEGMNVYITIHGAPEWVHGGSNAYGWGGCINAAGTAFEPNNPGCGPNYTQFDPGLGMGQSYYWKRFVTAAVQRYGTKVKYWGFWNESGVDIFWVPSRAGYTTPGCNSADAQLVSKVLRPGREAALAANPSVVIVGPEENITSHLHSLLTIERDGIAGCGNVPAGRLFDILSIHVYSFGPGVGIANGFDLFKAALDSYERREVWATEVEGEGGRFQEGLEAFTQRGWISKIFGYRMRSDPNNVCGGSEDGFIDDDRNACYSYLYTYGFSRNNIQPSMHLAGTTAIAGHDDFVVLQNPHGFSVPVTLRFTNSGGGQSLFGLTMPPYSRDARYIPTTGLAGQEQAVSVIPAVPWLPIWAEHADRWNGTQAGRAAQGSGERSDTWYFAEGVSAAGVFTEDITVFNPNAQAINVTWTYYNNSGSIITAPTYTIAALGHRRVRALDVGVTGDHSTKVSGLFGAGNPQTAPIVAERTISWLGDMDGHSSRGAPFAAPTWYFAEGNVTGGWSTHLLAFNPTNRWASVQAEYLTTSGVSIFGPVESIGPTRRHNITLPGGLGVFGVVVRSLDAYPVPIVVERAMYNGWNVGTVSEGATSPSQRLLFGEGSTEGPNYWVPSLLIANPSNVGANVSLDFRHANGSVITSPSISVAAKQRVTISPAAYGVFSAPFTTEVRVTSAVGGGVPPGIIAERTITWDGNSSLLGGHTVSGIP
jgi:hypothetical protein